MTSLLFRTSSVYDLDSLYELASESGIGITTFPQDKALIRQRLQLSEDSFNKRIHHPGSEYYFFVLEDPNTQTIVGTSAIEASVGQTTPFYSYKLSQRTRMHYELNIQHTDILLNLVNDHHHKSELCTLYLDPDYRHSHNGVFLSRARLIFMAEHPHRFESTVIAEMRGVTNEQGYTPFWSALGQHYLPMSFHEADELTLSTNKQFIADLFPDYPISTQLLPLDAQAVIGKTHPLTEPAMRILLKEGFQYNGYVDIFDGGPTIEVLRTDINTIKNSQTSPIYDIVDDVTLNRFLIGNTSLHFRACMGSVLQHPKGIIIHRETAELLQLKRRDKVRFCEF